MSTKKVLSSKTQEKSITETPMWANMSPEEKLKFMSDNKTSSISSTIPIVLVDNSGSTSSRISVKTTDSVVDAVESDEDSDSSPKYKKKPVYSSYSKTTGQSYSVLDYEVKMIQNKLQDLGCKECYLMFWNSSQQHQKDPVLVPNLQNAMKKMGISPTGGTDVSVAIENIPDHWYQKNTNIFIVTDGEVNEDKYKFYKQVFSLAKRYVNINIMTVENNRRNYMKDNVNAGANIFTVLQSNKLTKYVRMFECYNEFHTMTPFVNLCNPEVDKNQFSYKEYVFDDSKFNDFVNVICDMITLNKNNKDYLDKVMYFLSFTIFFYTKNKSQGVKNEIVRLFTSLFEEVFPDTKMLTNIFESEIVSHTEGSCKTYQQYKENRKRLFERTLDDLRNNVMECFGSGNVCMSFIVDTLDSNVKKIIESNSTNSYVRLSDTYYNNGGIHYGNHYLPMLPVKVDINDKNDDENGQALRQWIRAIYARVHKIQVNDERILYLFLTDMMSVLLSDIPDHIKVAWRHCAEVMLQAKRFNSGDLKQIVFLTMGNKPKPMISGYFTMDEILTQCKNHFSKDIHITLDELWYGICLTYNDKKLVKAQLPKDYDKTSLIDKLKAYNPIYLYEKIIVQKELEYQDYLTLEDISEVGGYKFPNYKYGKRVFNSSLLISEATYNELVSNSKKGTTKCPITGANIKLSDFIKLPPKSNNLNETIFDDGDFNMKIFNKQYFQRVNLHDADKMNLFKLPLHSTSSLDFNNYPYEFYPPVPIITEKLYKEKEQYKSFEDFSTQVRARFEWLAEVDMTNIVIAGGFNKSIIIDEKVNDIDIYIHNNEDDKMCLETLDRVVRDITNALDKKYKNIAYLVAYKKEFNVYELIYFENVNNLEKAQYEVQDLIKMKFITKIQIIMKKHLEPKDIFDLYDIDACTTLYDGKDLYFTDRSYLAYRYLVSVPRIDNHYTDTFDMRMLKYYKSGFRIALPRLTIDQIKEKIDEDGNLVINKLKFHVQQVENHNVFIDKCELLIEKIEKPEKEVDENTTKLNQTGVSVYNSVIGDIGSLDDSRSIVKFMKYVQRQNRLVQRVQKKLLEGEVVSEEALLADIDAEMKDELKEKLKDLKLKGRRYVKHEALLSDGEDEEEEEEEENDVEDDDVLEIEYNIIDASEAETTVTVTVNSEVAPVDAEATPVATNTETLTAENVEPVKAPEDYIRVYYRVSTPDDVRQMNEFDNGTCELKFIWTYENYHKQKDWYNSNVEITNKVIEEKERLAKEEKEKLKKAMSKTVDAIDSESDNDSTQYTRPKKVSKRVKSVSSSESESSESDSEPDTSPKPVQKKASKKIQSESESSESESSESEASDQGVDYGDDDN